MTFEGAGGNSECTAGATTCDVSHDPSTALDEKRSLLAVLTNDTQSITSVTVTAGGAAGGWTARGTFSGHGKKWSLFDKICGPSEPTTYTVTFSPAISGPSPANCVIAYLADFTAAGDPIRATGSASGAADTTLTLPSLTASNAEDVFAAVWDDPATSEGYLRAQSPLTGTDAFTGGLDLWTQLGYENYQSSAATGTRTFSVASGTYTTALGVIMLVGATSGGGWGVGQIRMAS